MRHLTEDQLVLYHYGEGGGLPRQSIEEHLASCDACRSNYQGLRQLLAAVDASPVPERTEAYGREVWQRLSPSLEAAPTERAAFDWRAFFQQRRWAPMGAVSGLVLMAFLLGRFWPRREAPPVAAMPAQVRERILLVAVGEHLERSQMVLIELVNAEPSGSVDISPEQQRARDLVPTNRLYRQTAARAGEVGMASVLDELERTLLEIAHSPSILSSNEFEALRGRIEAQGILFKVRVIGSQVEEREQAGAKELARRSS